MGNNLDHVTKTATPYTTVPSNMLSLPNEIMCQVAGYLAPAWKLSKWAGHSMPNDVGDSASGFGNEQNGEYNKNIRDLLSLGRTCKQLAPVAQEILYRSVALRQPAVAGRQTTPLVSFLRTLIMRPDLAVLVEYLSIWILKSKPIHAVPKATDSLEPILARMVLTPDERSNWREDLHNPTEAMLCSLIFAGLPKLKIVELYAQPSPVSQSDIEKFGPFKQNDIPHEISRLAQGLATTKIRDLALSTELNGISAARLPSLQTLTLDHSGSNPVVNVPKGSFANVTTLQIQSETPPGTLGGRLHLKGAYTWRIDKLCNSLPSLRTLEFDSERAVQDTHIASRIETVVIRPADFDAVNWGRAYLGSLTGKEKIKRVEMWWRDDWPFHTIWRLYEELVRKTGVKVVVGWRGEVRKVFE
ncbi:hypothetical protein FB567DRAFT_436104 [Paraphoma chrysanthemicola]|uniref:F-box domain-containing protein n=1 Tax=Paraphoma chrysanthemicola TaxID=798071 RepID=A0A8K0REM8_9PLEO|nr:hypothetical protein FB567DRAFT_436104 [Paraphoma chrysanthemicola]